MVIDVGEQTSIAFQLPCEQAVPISTEVIPGLDAQMAMGQGHVAGEDSCSLLRCQCLFAHFVPADGSMKTLDVGVRCAVGECSACGAAKKERYARQNCLLRGNVAAPHAMGGRCARDWPENPHGNCPPTRQAPNGMSHRGENHRSDRSPAQAADVPSGRECPIAMPAARQHSLGILAVTGLAGDLKYGPSR